VSLLLNEDRGDTLYLGAPASDQRGRLYDKQRESNEQVWERCWRYEVQFRRGAALSALQSVASGSSEGDTVAAMVHGWFGSRGCNPHFRPVVTAELASPTRKAPDDERWLRWVRRCVQPTARRMAVRYGWRYVAEACVGRIASVEDWESMMRDWESELTAVEEDGL
jgi:DNA relaxase NicK